MSDFSQHFQSSQSAGFLAIYFQTAFDSEKFSQTTFLA